VSWLRLELYCKESDIPYVENTLEHFQPISLSIEADNNSEFFETAIEEYPIWDEVRLLIIFSSDLVQQTREKLIKHFQMFRPHFFLMENEDWVRSFHLKNKPIFIGKKFCICPSWEKEKKIDRSIIIRLDPGQAFGTGSHETTQLCLEYLEKINLEGKTLVDYGCGSGILGIAAVKLGAEKVICIDNDKNSIDVTTTNAKENNTMEKMRISLECDNKRIKSDIVISNIFSSVLIGLIQDFANILKPSGTLILSGILKSQIDEFIEKFECYFELLDLKYKNEWCLVVLKKINYKNASNR